MDVPLIGSVDRTTDHQQHSKPGRRTILFTIRLSELEAQILAAAAARADRPASEIVRERVFGPTSGLERRLEVVEEWIEEHKHG